MIKVIEALAKQSPKGQSADFGHCSETNLKILEDSGILGHVTAGRRRRGTAAATGAKAPREETLCEKMAQFLEQDGRDSLRRCVIAPCTASSSALAKVGDGNTISQSKYRSLIIRSEPNSAEIGWDSGLLSFRGHAPGTNSQPPDWGILLRRFRGIFTR